MAKTDDMATDEAPAPAPSAAEAVPAKKEPTLAERLSAVVAIVEKAVKAKDTRMMMGRLLRQTAVVRPLLTGTGLVAFLKTVMPADMDSSTFLQGQLAKVGRPGPSRPAGSACEALDRRRSGPRSIAEPLPFPLPQVADASTDMTTDASTSGAPGAPVPPTDASSVLPEVEMYAYLLAMLLAVDSKNLDMVRAPA